MLFALPIKSFAQPFVEFTAQSTTVDCATSTLSIDIDVKDFIQMNSFDYSFHWDPSVLTLTSIDDPAVIPSILIGQNGANTGILTFSWFSTITAGNSIPDGTLVTLNFDLIGNASQTSGFTFDDIPTFINVAQYGMALTSSDYTFTDGLLTITDTVNPTITCPSGPLTFDTGGATTTQITGASPTAADNCAIDFISYELTMNGSNVGVGTGDVSSNVNFQVGTTTVTYTANDFGGNTETCSFDVVVTNTSTPTMMTISMDNNLQVNCEDNTVSFNIYADAFNDIRSGQFTISWPVSALQYIDTSNYAITVGTTAFGTTNISSGQLLYSWNHDSEISLPNGTILFTIEFNVTSPAGLTIPISFVPSSDEFTNDASTVFPFLPIDPSLYSMINGSVYIFDNVDPTITCPADITVISTNGTDAVVNGIAPTTADNCGIMDTTFVLTDVATTTIIGNGIGDASGTTFPVGTTNVEYTVTDFDGNQASCNFDVTVQIPGLPTVSVDSIEVNCETGTVTIGMPVENFIDVIGLQFTIEWDPTKLEFVSVVEDNFDPDGTLGLGQVANGSFNFSWFDISNPTTFSDGDNILVLEFNILDQTVGNDYDFTFAGAPSPYAVITQSSFPNNDPDAITEPGNIEIIDTTTPMITCPADVTVNSNGAPSVVVNNIGATATDNCGTPSISYVIAGAPPTIGSGDASGSSFLVGTTMVTYTAIDEGGNSVSCSFNITVIQDPLMIECPLDVLQGTDANVCFANLDLPITILSNPTNVNSISWDITGASGSFSGTGNISNFVFSVGTSNIVYNVTDIFGASETCSLDVTINDLEGPIISGVPADVTVECDNIPTAASPTANDQCDGITTVNLISESVAAGPIPGSSIITRTWSTVDAAGNISIANQSITAIDTTAPTLICPSDIVITTLAVQGCGANVTWTVPTATDNCDSDVQVATSSPFSPGDLFPLGTTEITYFAVDDAGNLDSCKFNVTVSDVDAPIFLNCPSDMTVPSGVSCDTVVTWFEPTVIDNCDNNVVVISSPSQGTAFMAGTTTVTYTATDASGNISTCSFDITVTDTEAPIMTDCPTDITSPAGNNCSAGVIWNLPTVTDNCDPNPTIVSNPQSGVNFSVGSTPVTITATDANGNVSTCSFNVIIIDAEPPSVFCPPNISVSTSGDITDPIGFITSITPVGCDSVILTFDNPTGNDNCGIPTVSQVDGLISGSTFGIGDHVIQFEAMDGSGNISTDLCETTITVTSFVSLNVTTTPDTICTGGSTQLFADPSTPVLGGTYSWTGPNPNRMIPDIENPLLEDLIMEDSGTYIVTITDPLTNCTSTDSVLVVVSLGPELAMIVNTVNCVDPDGSTDIPLSVQVTNGIPVDSFIWTNPSGTVFSNDQNTVIPNASESDAGIYCVEVFEENGCSNTICDTIQITNIPGAPIIVSECGDFVCVGESCTLTGVSIQVDSMIWTATGDDPGLPTDVNQSEISITPGQNGINLYTYTIYENGCESSSSISVIVSSEADVLPDLIPVDLNTTVNNFDVTLNDTIPGSLPGIFSINVTSDVTNGFLINNGDGTFTYTPDNGFLGDDQFIYEICLDCNGQEVCQWAVVTLSIETDECIVPTVISPNGDGFNDTWEISCVKNSPNNEVLILNRWGDEVYRAAPYNNDWEGTYNNEKLPDGTYFYIFKTTANDPNPLKGTLNIYR